MVIALLYLGTGLFYWTLYIRFCRTQ